MIMIPESALRFGFDNGPGGAHTSRTMMLSELQLLLAACPSPATYAEYRAAILEENCLLKQTATTRLRSLRALRELYSLDRRVLIFRALRDLWDADAGAQPLLACLCANARDPLLRSSADLILGVAPGEAVTASGLSTAIVEAFPGHYNSAILLKIGRNAASSWEQSGHVARRQPKVRSHARSSPAATAYALLLGHLCDVRGDFLFGTLWARLLDTPMSLLHEHALAAHQQGWLEYRRSGDVTEVSFRHLLRQENASPLK
jgi:hypothetical protein